MDWSRWDYIWLIIYVMLFICRSQKGIRVSVILNDICKDVNCKTPLENFIFIFAWENVGLCYLPWTKKTRIVYFLFQLIFEIPRAKSSKVYLPCREVVISSSLRLLLEHGFYLITRGSFRSAHVIGAQECAACCVHFSSHGHHERYGASNHRQFDCLFNSLFKFAIKQI